MRAKMRCVASAWIAAGVLVGCAEIDVAERTGAVVVEPGDTPPRVRLPDGGPELVVATVAEGELPRQLAFVDAGRDAECHDACPARCGEDEICCYSTGMCVPLDCWECCPDMGSRSGDINRAAGEPP